MFLTKWRIRQRIYFFFGTGVLILIFLGGYALASLFACGEAMRSMHQYPHMVSVYTLSASENIIRMHRALKAYAAASTDLERQTILSQLETLENATSDHLDIVEERIPGEKGKRLVKKIRHGFRSWDPIRKEIIRLAKSGEPAQARLLAEGRGSDAANRLEKKLSSLKQYAREEADHFLKKSGSENSSNRNVLIGLMLVFVVVLIVLAVWTANTIAVPLERLQKTSEALGAGKLPEIEKTEEYDEIAAIRTSMLHLVKNLKARAEFALRIGEGDVNAEFSALSEDDIVGNALANMRDRLKKISADEKERNWSNVGMAKFVELLQAHQEDMQTMGKKLLVELVGYLDANQAAFYLVQHQEGNSTLEMISSYAWDRVKHQEKTLGLEEGLIGQAVLERATLNLKNLPEDYIKIGSGLGKAKPQNVVIVPLIYNEEAYGALELAAFRAFKDFEVQFLEQLTSSIASTVSAVRNREKTRALLEEAQHSHQQIAAQEEELRQNAEALQVTQEEMLRRSGVQDQEMETLRTALAECRKKADDTSDDHL